VNQALEQYRFDDAANAIYQFFWGSFCDWYLEIVKLRFDFGESANKSAVTRDLTVLVQVFVASLRMLSPFMPFLTEELWHAVYDGKAPSKSIAFAKYPFEDESMIEESAIRQMQLMQSVIADVRALRKEIDVEEKAVVPIEIRTDTAFHEVVEENRDIIERLARVSEVRYVDEISAGLSKHSTPQFDVAVIYERTIDVAAERERLTKEIAKREKQDASDERQLNDPAFVAKAPAHIVEGKKKQMAENRLLLEKAKAALEALPKE
jgi:valyl-tRNA synthetase